MSMPLADNSTPVGSSTPQDILTEYILGKSQEFCSLQKLRRQGWENPVGDEFFRNQRQQADNPSEIQKSNFYQMTINIGQEIQEYAGAFKALEASPNPAALDLGMAPGGFSATILNQYPATRMKGITLPHAKGGHDVRLRHVQLELEYQDLNVLAQDLGVSVPASNPKANSLATEPMFSTVEKYDVVICGAQVTRNQEREEWRQKREPRRLELAQIIIAMRLLRPGGSLVLVSHKPESIDTAETLYKLSQFSDLSLFKPTKGHAKRSSFYVVAKNVNVLHPLAIKYAQACREEWKVATLGEEADYQSLVRRDLDDAKILVQNFGPRLLELGKPVWEIQAQALRKAPFVKRSVRKVGA